MRVKPLDIRPLTFPMDARSAPDEFDLKGWRYIKNFRVNAKNRLCRVTGFRRLIDSENYNNEDFHDQLTPVTGLTERSPVTFLFEGNSTSKSTKLYAGNHHLLAALNTGTGNWRVIATGHGNGSSTRWKADQLNDVVLFTNNFDPPRYHLHDQGVVNGEATSLVPDLVKLGITRAGTVVTWKNHVFLMNVTIKGEVRSHAVYWCNYDRPLDWIPMEGSTAGYQDLDFGESIVGAKPLGNRLLIYTTRGIWELVTATGGGPVFVALKRYDPQQFGEACLFYPNTLVTVGNEHLYMGIDGVYLYNLYEEKPKRIEYIHKASSVIFDDINRENCDVHVGGYDFENKEVIFSWARDGEELPSRSLVVNTEFPFAYVLDYGYSAMVNYVYKGKDYLLRDWLRENCICSDEALDSVWNQFENEGGFCRPETPIICGDAAQRLTEDGQVRVTEDGIIRVTEDGGGVEVNRPLWSSDVLVLDEAEGISTEDWDGEMSEDSLCDYLDGKTLNDICESQLRREECNSGQRFVVASSADFSLKEHAKVYYREEVTGFTGCGTYSRKGYRSLLRSGAISAGVYDMDKELSRFSLEATSETQGTPSRFKLRIGRHGQAIDPNEDNCGIVWEEQPAIDIKCLSDATAAKHRQMGTIPDGQFSWPMWYRGLYFFFELEVVNDKVTPPDTGGAVCLSRYTMDMRTRENRR